MSSERSLPTCPDCGYPMRFGACSVCIPQGAPTFAEQYGFERPARGHSITIIDAAEQPLRAGYNDVG